MRTLRRPYSSRLALIVLFAAPLFAQSGQQYGLRVNGAPIATARPASRIADEWFVPLVPVARALGAEVQLNPQFRSLRVVLNDGTVASYDGISGRIFRGAVLAGEVVNFRLVDLTTGAENILFPLSGVIPLFRVTAREDRDQAVLEIDAIPPAAAGVRDGPAFQLSSLDYKTSVLANDTTWQQTTAVHADALAGSHRITAAADVGRFSGSSFLKFRTGFVRVEATPTISFTLGDQAGGRFIEALQNTVRGAGVTKAFGDLRVSLYGGRAASTISASLGTLGLPRYDSTIAGLDIERRLKTVTFAFGANSFQSPNRRGIAAGGAILGRAARNEFRLQGVAGNFSGASLRQIYLYRANRDGEPLPGTNDANQQPVAVTPSGSVISTDQVLATVRGAAYGLSVTDAFTPFKGNQLTLTGAFDRYSRNFLVVRQDARFSAVNRSSASAVVRPNRFVSFNGGINRSRWLLGDPNPQNGLSYGATVAPPGKLPLVLSYFHSGQRLTSFGPSRFDLDQYSAHLPRIGRFSASAVMSDVKFNQIRSRAFTETVSVNFKRYGRFSAHDQRQLGNIHSYGGDWNMQFRRTGTNILFGLERQTARNMPSYLAPVAALTVPLPRGQTFRFSYMNQRGYQMMQFEISGPIIRPREMVQTETQQVLRVLSTLTGQIYHDANNNGAFDPATDRPLANLKVIIDGHLSTTTDSRGYYNFDGLTPGSHRVQADIRNVPANLVLMTEEYMAIVIPYRQNEQNFRAVETGRILGRVSLITPDERGRPQTVAYPNIRVVAAATRDSYSEEGGIYVLTDLPPGTYQVRPDPAFIPAGFIARPAVRTVRVSPNQTTRDIDFELSRPVVVKQAPPLPPKR